MDVFMLLIFLFCLFDTALCGSYCYDSGNTFYCEYGCCGNTLDEYCCGVYSWIIAVAVIGGIIVIGIIVTVIIVYKKKKTKTGRVINTAPQTHVQTTTFVHAPPPGYQQQPQPYQQNSQGVYPPPPPVNYGADPAYPPVKY